MLKKIWVGLILVIGTVQSQDESFVKVNFTLDRRSPSTYYLNVLTTGILFRNGTIKILPSLEGYSINKKERAIDLKLSSNDLIRISYKKDGMWRYFKPNNEKYIPLKYFLDKRHVRWEELSCRA